MLHSATYGRMLKKKNGIWNLKLKITKGFIYYAPRRGGGRSPLYITVYVAQQHMLQCFASTRFALGTLPWIISIRHIYQVCSGACLGPRTRQLIFQSKANIIPPARPKCSWPRSIFTSKLVQNVFQEQPSLHY